MLAIHYYGMLSTVETGVLAIPVAFKSVSAQSSNVEKESDTKYT